MKSLVSLISLIVSLVTANSADLQWRFNRTSNVMEFRYEAKAQHCYMLVRFDIKADYYDCVHFLEATNNVPVSVAVNPLMTGEDLNPKPSGQCYFYLVETSNETPQLRSFSGASDKVRKAWPVLP